ARGPRGPDVRRGSPPGPIRPVTLAFLRGRSPAMTLRPALLAVATLAIALWATLALCRWGGRGQSDLSGLARAVGHGEELEAHLEAGRRRDEAKRALAAEVIARRMSLREAAGSRRQAGRLEPERPGGGPACPGPVGPRPGQHGPGCLRGLRGHCAPARAEVPRPIPDGAAQDRVQRQVHRQPGPPRPQEAAGRGV